MFEMFVETMTMEEARTLSAAIHVRERDELAAPTKKQLTTIIIMSIRAPALE